MTDREERIRRQEALLAVYEEAKAQLMQYPGVVGVGIGLKERGITLTHEFCFRVYVEEKVPLAHRLLRSYRSGGLCRSGRGRISPARASGREDRGDKQHP